VDSFSPLTPAPESPGSSPVAAADYPDRSTGLTIFGILQILLGGLSLLLIPFILLSAVMSRKVGTGPLPAGSYVAGICSYSFFAAALITLGIGSTRARRWARALNLILSWVGLIFGVFGTIAIMVVVPSSFKAVFRQAAVNTPNAPPMPVGVATVVLTLMIVFFSVLFVAVPLAFLLFFSRKDVEETCRRRDPVERWTDRAPLPVLAVSMLLAFGAVYSLLMSVTTPLFPFFGKYATGIPASAALIALAVLDGYLAFAFYRLRPLGWWIAVSALALRVISTVLTYRRGDLLQAYSHLGWSQTQIDMMRSNPGFRSGLGMMWWGVGLSVVMFGYLIWIKRYFTTSTRQDGITGVPSSPQIAS
jgi:hypothetical protein